jgi:hypothetical protein
MADVIEACCVEEWKALDMSTEEISNINQVNRVSADDTTNANPPEHLEVLLEQLESDLNTEQLQKARKLIVQYEDVFAKNDLDLGKFTAIKHKINTGNARPIKQSARRTP